MTRLFVTGAGGMVGSYVLDVFGADGVALTDIVPGSQEVDVTDPKAVRAAIEKAQPEVVLHLAAATDVDRCEQEPDWAYRVNSIGTQNVALACLATGATLVYISTAGVFGGDKPEPYTEFDEPDPANVYGAAKLAGERIVTSLLTQYYIVRAGWMVGGGTKDKKFVGKITELIDRGETRLRVVDDKFGSPTYARDLLGGIQALLQTGYYGLYHMVNRGTCSRYDVALAIRELLGRYDVEIEPVSSAYFPLPAQRARSEMMRNYKLELLGMDEMRPWSEALGEYLGNELVPPTLRATGVPS